MSWLKASMRNLTGFVVSLVTWYSHRASSERYRAQAHAVAAWVVREVRKMLPGKISTDLDWELDQFQLFLAHAIYQELVTNDGYFPISHSPLVSPAALFRQAVADARIHPPDPVVNALPYMRIRIVPGWVKVYSINAPHSAPITLYPDRFAK